MLLAGIPPFGKGATRSANSAFWAGRAHPFTDGLHGPKIGEILSRRPSADGGYNTNYHFSNPLSQTLC
jgi:hypothetical protein